MTTYEQALMALRIAVNNVEIARWHAEKAALDLEEAQEAAQEAKAAFEIAERNEANR
jgi:hypothetical protein